MKWMLAALEAKRNKKKQLFQFVSLTPVHPHVREEFGN